MQNFRNILIIAAAITVIFPACVTVTTVIPEKEQVYDGQSEAFCGWSTFGRCSCNSDCKTAGCSQEVCMSAVEGPIITIGERRQCFDARKYNLNCSCLRGKCMWAK